MVVNSYPFAERLRTSSRIRCFRPHDRSDDPTGPTGRAGRFLLAGVATAVLALAGCSSAAAPGGQGGTGTPAKVMLKFNLTGGPGGQAKHWTLNCEPTGGTHPSPAAACAVLLKMKSPFAPRSKQIACPMILRSDRKILVTGTWLGVTVHRVVIDGGCDLVLFSKLDKILH
ncbi:MAG TPA: SSI family serine proteinase inhibitor [Streptosporangiaceae bacterium]|nr:SSI family serine proteinase inhibitor [Streptosporangiaceae bacterium]